MIEIAENSEFTQLTADFIANLMAVLEQEKEFKVSLALTGYDNIFMFDSSYHIEFLQEGIHLSKDNAHHYVLYDIIDMYNFVIV